MGEEGGWGVYSQVVAGSQNNGRHQRDGAGRSQGQEDFRCIENEDIDLQTASLEHFHMHFRNSVP